MNNAMSYIWATVLAEMEAEQAEQEAAIAMELSAKEALEREAILSELEELMGSEDTSYHFNSKALRRKHRKANRKSKLNREINYLPKFSKKHYFLPGTSAFIKHQTNRRVRHIIVIPNGNAYRKLDCELYW